MYDMVAIAGAYVGVQSGRDLLLYLAMKLDFILSFLSFLLITTSYSKVNNKL